MAKSHYRSIIRLGLPILVGQVGMVVLVFADTAMVGHYDTDSLAAASFVNNLFNMALFTVGGFALGITPILGAQYTRGEKSGMGATLRSGVAANVAFTLLVAAIMTAVYFNLHRMGQPDKLLPLIRPYFLLYLAGLVPMSLFNVFAQWSYARGNSQLPMWIMLSANALNILGNWLLIYGHCGFPQLGLLGAGISTLASRLLGPAVLLGVFFIAKRYREYSGGFRRAAISAKSLRPVIACGFPVAMQMACESGSFSLSAVMAGWLPQGDICLAAFQVIIVTGTLGFTLYYSVGTAVSVLVANQAGLGSSAGMRSVAWAGYRCLLVMTCCSCMAFICFGRQIMGLFSSDPMVVALAMTLLFPLVLYQVADATQINFANALRGTSHVMPMLWIAFGSYMVIGVPVTYLFAFPLGLGLYGIVLSFSVSLCVAAALFLYYFMRATRLEPVSNNDD
ncbi:MAG: MATE family efflux transporter [Muribaculaceae bacterium]|nr:MATE family efflux transporter [Muribaculaceae bacterium]